MGGEYGVAFFCDSKVQAVAHVERCDADDVGLKLVAAFALWTVLFVILFR